MDQANSEIKKIKKQIKADPELRDMLVRSGRNEIMLDLDGDGAADLCLSCEGGGDRIDTLALDLSGNGDFNLFSTMPMGTASRTRCSGRTMNRTRRSSSLSGPRWSRGSSASRRTSTRS